MFKWYVTSTISGSVTRRVPVEAERAIFDPELGVATFYIGGQPVKQILHYLSWELVQPEVPPWYEQLTEREMQQVKLSRWYAAETPSAGMPGHSQMLLVAKLCDLLEGETS